MGNYYEHSFMLYNSILEDMRYLANMPLNCILNAKERTYSDPQSYFHSFYRYISGNNRHDTIIFLEELNINLSVFNVGPYKNMLNVGQIINESSSCTKSLDSLLVFYGNKYGKEDWICHELRQQTNKFQKNLTLL